MWVLKSNCCYGDWCTLCRSNNQDSCRWKLRLNWTLIPNAAIIDHHRFSYSGTSLILKVVQGDTGHCVQNNILEVYRWWGLVKVLLAGEFTEGEIKKSSSWLGCLSHALKCHFYPVFGQIPFSHASVIMPEAAFLDSILLPSYLYELVSCQHKLLLKTFMRYVLDLQDRLFIYESQRPWRPVK